MSIQKSSIMKVDQQVLRTAVFVLLFGIFVYSLITPINAQSRISISKVRLEITIYDYDGRVRPEAQPAVKQAKYQIGNIWKGSEFKEDFFSEAIADIYESASFIIEVLANEGYYFSSTDVTFKGFDVKCVRQEYKDENEILYLLCEFGSLAEWGENVADKSWESVGMAAWQSVPGAEVYILKLYQDSRVVGSTYSTQGNHYDFRPLMLEEDNYHYTIQAVMDDGVLSKIIASPNCYVSKPEAEQFTSSFAIPENSEQAHLKGIYSGWQQTSQRWWYRNEDNTYDQDSWKQIGDNWYYFDCEGYMVVGQWITWKGQSYYLTADGSMQ